MTSVMRTPTASSTTQSHGSAGTWNDTALGRLAAGGWLMPATGPGLVVFTAKFESVLARLNAALTAVAPAESAGPQWCPPVMAESDLRRAEYDEAFPNLLGVVTPLASAITDPRPRHSDGSVLVPVVCYGVYPQLAGSVLDRAAYFDVAGYCYRHEGTSELGRLRSFRVRDFVVVGGEEEARSRRDEWITLGTEFYRGIGLSVDVRPASDPFFGPTDQFLRASQLEQQLKYEFVAMLGEGGPELAIGSVNCHKDHLGARFGIGYRDQGAAHSSCIGFGLERIVLALITAHGDDLAHWPAFH